MAKKLTLKQSKFVAAYDGNGVKAMRAAGYAGNEDVLAVEAVRLLRNPRIKKAIEKRSEKKISKLIATREERQQFWTEVMKSKTSGRVPMVARLKASELLGKSEADFTEKTQNANANMDVAVIDPVAAKAMLDKIRNDC